MRQSDDMVKNPTDYPQRPQLWMRSRLYELGKPQRALSLALGRDDDATASKIISGIRKIKASEMPEVASALQLPLEEVIRRYSEAEGNPNHRHAAISQQGAQAQVTSPVESRPTQRPSGPRPIRSGENVRIEHLLLGIKVMESVRDSSKKGDGVLTGAVMETIPRPERLLGLDNVFSVYMPTDRMSPRWDIGDPLIVHPGRPCKPGDDVYVELLDDKNQVHFSIRRLVRETSTHLTVAQLNPHREQSFTWKDVRHLYKVLRLVDIFGR